MIGVTTLLGAFLIARDLQLHPNIAPSVQNGTAIERIEPVSIPTSTLSIKELEKRVIYNLSDEKGIDADLVEKIAACESHLDPHSVGDHKTSFGIFQIHIPAHPDISKKQALDPIWSIDWATDRMAEGKYNMWSCYKLVADNAP